MRRARPDGCLLTQGPISVFRLPFTRDSPGWTPPTDVPDVARITRHLFGIVVRAGSPCRSPSDRIAWARRMVTREGAMIRRLGLGG